jgi:hypothetical protein
LDELPIFSRHPHSRAEPILEQFGSGEMILVTIGNEDAGVVGSIETAEPETTAGPRLGEPKIAQLRATLWSA